MKPAENAYSQAYTCGSCAMFYFEYKQLLEHLYWRHGTESELCKSCGLKKWKNALHVCNFLPIADVVAEYQRRDSEMELCEETERQYCVCGQWSESEMIGCDGPQCDIQWYHFTCVGIIVPPEGDWFCPNCIFKELKKTKMDISAKGTNKFRS